MMEKLDDESSGSNKGTEAGLQQPQSEISLYNICATLKSKAEEAVGLIEDDSAKQLDIRKVKEIEYNIEYSELEKATIREQDELRSQGVAASTADIHGGEVRRQEDDSSKKQPEPSRSTEVEPVVSNKNRKRVKNNDPTDIDGYAGPWATFEDERHTSKPSEEDAAVIAEYLAKRRKRSAPLKEDAEADPSLQEKAQLHIKDPYDYQGRSFLQAPRDLDNVNLYEETSPDGCRIPRTLIHTYRGHTKAVTATRYFPKTAHLILSSSLDNKVKLWEMYKERRCVMTYSGHKQGVRDICFNRDGDKFVSASYDRYLKLWDTETGQCLQRFTNNKMAYCVKFNPDPECSHMFLAGMSNKKILCWDCRSGEIVQEYDRHLGAVNTITFVDENRKFISSSDDKSLRVWEWDIPVDVKYIADPTLHSMPAVTSAPNNKRLLCQSMDNKIQAFTCHNKFKLDSKKIFRGHMVAGYACVPDFSCDMSLVISGDADGKIFFWSWSTTKIITTIKAHDSACISVMWHPHERQKLVSAGWDNLIKIWG